MTANPEATGARVLTEAERATKLARLQRFEAALTWAKPGVIVLYVIMGVCFFLTDIWKALPQFLVPPLVLLAVFFIGWEFYLRGMRNILRSALGLKWP